MFELKAFLEQAFHPAFGQEKNTPLLNFLGNHDVSRIASHLEKEDYIHQRKLLN